MTTPRPHRDKPRGKGGDALLSVAMAYSLIVIVLWVGAPSLGTPQRVADVTYNHEGTFAELDNGKRVYVEHRLYLDGSVGREAHCLLGICRVQGSYSMLLRNVYLLVSLVALGIVYVVGRALSRGPLPPEPPLGGGAEPPA